MKEDNNIIIVLDDDDKEVNKKKVLSGNVKVMKDLCLLNPIFMEDDVTEYEYGNAYIDPESFIFYVFKGNYVEGVTELLPGYIYKDKEGKFIRVEPKTPEEKEACHLNGKLADMNTTEIIHILKSQDECIVNFQDSCKAFIPPITNEDDILKRAIKSVLLEKNIDIDRYKDRFPDKNALFNFKSVVKGDSKVSMLLFERACNAFNLKYTIILDEIKNPETNEPSLVVGTKLNAPVIVSSEDKCEL